MTGKALEYYTGKDEQALKSARYATRLRAQCFV
jgi:hypothetical protein